MEWRPMQTSVHIFKVHFSHVLVDPHSSSLAPSLPPSLPSLDTQVAPLWDSAARKFVGIMVITDFIDTVRRGGREGGREGLDEEHLKITLELNPPFLPPSLPPSLPFLGPRLL